MAFADTAPLVALLKLDDKFSGPLKSAQKTLGQFDAKLDATATRGYRAGQQIGTGIKNGLKVAAVGLGLLASQIALGLGSLVKLEKAEAQTAAVIRSTNAIAGIQVDVVRRLAEKYEALNATVGDEFIQAGENLLLTFTNIRKDAFEPALKTALDMNTALGKGPEGLTDTVRILGKALNDPAKGLTALQRIGIRFTDDQKAQITTALKANDTFKAQGIILAELNRRFGGSFIAQGGTTGGKVAKFTDSIEDLQRALATALLPTVGKVADRLSTFLADPKVVAGISDLGTKIAGLFNDENINTGAGILKGLFNAAKDAAPAIQAAAEVTGQVVKTAVGIFRSLPPELQALAVAGLAINKLTGGLVTNIAGGLISAVLKQLVSGVVNVTGAVVNVVGGGKGPGGSPIPPVTGPLALATLPFVLKGDTPTSGDPRFMPAAGEDTQRRIFELEREQKRLARLNPSERFGVAGDQTVGQRLTEVRDQIKALRSGTPSALRQAFGVVAANEDQNTLRQEKAIMRAAQLTKTASDKTAAAVRAKDLTVTVPVNTSLNSTTFLNGRLISANLERFQTVLQGGSGVLHNGAN